jgi:hypothetical protein
MSFFNYILENKQWIFSGIGVSVLIFIVATVRYLVGRLNSVQEPSKTQKSSGTVQTGSFVIDVGAHDVMEIFYPTPFKSPPYLKVWCSSGGIGLQIKDQRSDGFLLEPYGSGWGSHAGITVVWEAQGCVD